MVRCHGSRQKPIKKYSKHSDTTYDYANTCMDVCIAFGLIVGSWYAVGISLIGHFLLLGAVGITVATFETAKRKPQIFMNGLRGKGGEHE